MYEDFNKLLRTRYVPSSAYVRFKPKEIKKYFYFKSLIIRRKDQVVNVKSEYQYRLYKDLCNGNFYNQVIGISGIPNDILAQQVASLILLSNFKRIDGEFEWFNTGFIKPKEETPKIVIIYNVIPDKERCYKIRDILDKHPKALRLVIVSGINALNYFDNYLYYPISGMIHLEEIVKEAPIPDVNIKHKNYPVFNDISSIRKAL